MSSVCTDQATLEKIAESYSADKLSENNTIRKPFTFRGKLYTVTGSMSSGGYGYYHVNACELIPADHFQGRTFDYHMKDKLCDRNLYPRGCHYGQRCSNGINQFVMGNELIFKYDPDQPAVLVNPIQMSLFNSATTGG